MRQQEFDAVRERIEILERHMEFILARQHHAPPPLSVAGSMPDANAEPLVAPIEDMVPHPDLDDMVPHPEPEETETHPDLDDVLPYRDNPTSGEQVAAEEPGELLDEDEAAALENKSDETDDDATELDHAGIEEPAENEVTGRIIRADLQFDDDGDDFDQRFFDFADYDVDSRSREWLIGG